MQKGKQHAYIARLAHRSMAMSVPLLSQQFPPRWALAAPPVLMLHTPCASLPNGVLTNGSAFDVFSSSSRANRYRACPRTAGPFVDGDRSVQSGVRCLGFAYTHLCDLNPTGAKPQGQRPVRGRRCRPKRRHERGPKRTQSRFWQASRRSSSSLAF